MSSNISIDMNIESHASEALEALHEARGVFLEEIGLIAEGYAKDYCPVDTGRLRNSISHAVDESDNAVVIGTNVEYAAYVELGTSRMEARPYLEPAFLNHMDEYQQIINDALGDS